MKIKTIVKCPECGCLVVGTITHDISLPFPDYYAHCDNCNYDITESDWEVMK